VLKACYSKAIRQYTPLGQATIDRPTFYRLYHLARTQAYTIGNVLAGWVRSGFAPVNRQRILDLPEVMNSVRSVPTLGQPMSTRTDRQTTPFDPINARLFLLDQSNIHTTPKTRRSIRNLARTAMASEANVARLAYELELSRRAFKTDIANRKREKLAVDEEARLISYDDIRQAVLKDPGLDLRASVAGGRKRQSNE
jgi:hypothetical protein